MPRGDGTGPIGQGPMTGRGLGNCIAYGIPALAGAAMAFGLGRRRGWFGQGTGFGRGFSRGFGGAQYVASSEGELSELKNQAQAMEEGLKDIRNRISELEKK